jgi:hypothetical protein
MWGLRIAPNRCGSRWTTASAGFWAPTLPACYSVVPTETKQGNITIAINMRATSASCIVVVSTFPGEGLTCIPTIGVSTREDYPTRAGFSTTFGGCSGLGEEVDMRRSGIAWRDVQAAGSGGGEMAGGGVGGGGVSG